MLIYFWTNFNEPNVIVPTAYTDLRPELFAISDAYPGLEIVRSNASFGSTSTIYNSTTVTYNSTTQVYGGNDRAQDAGPEIHTVEVIYVKPSLVEVL